MEIEFIDPEHLFRDAFLYPIPKFDPVRPKLSSQPHSLRASPLKPISNHVSPSTSPSTPSSSSSLPIDDPVMHHHQPSLDYEFISFNKQNELDSTLLFGNFSRNDNIQQNNGEETDTNVSVFTNYMHLRETRALHNWQRHSKMWRTVELELATKLNRNPHSLAMAQIHKYRSYVEDRHLIEEAIKVLEANYDFWMQGLRVGHDLFGLNLPLPRTGPRPLERVVQHPSNLEANIPSSPQYSINYQSEGYYLSSRLNQLHKAIHLLDPTFTSHDHLLNPDIRLSGLKVKGQSIFSSSFTQSHQHAVKQALHQHLAQLSENNFPSNDLINDPSEENNPIELSTKQGNIDNNNGIVPESSILITLSHSNMTFDTFVDVVSASAFSLYNSYDWAIRFEWVNYQPEFVIPVPNHFSLEQIHHTPSEDVFYLPVRKGVLLPHSAFDFHVIFKGLRPGIYSSNYRLVTQPNIFTNVRPIQLSFSGICIEDDKLALARQAYHRKLQHIVGQSIARDTLEAILKSMWIIVEHNIQASQTNATARLFVERNSQYKLKWTPQLNQRLNDIYNRISKVELDLKHISPWDLRIETIMNMMDFVVDLGKRELLLQELNRILTSSATSGVMNSANLSSHSNTLIKISRSRFVAARSVWLDLLDQIGDRIASIRRSFHNIPQGTDRSCVRKFTLPDISDDDNTNLSVIGTGNDGLITNNKAGTDKRGSMANDKRLIGGKESTKIGGSGAGGGNNATLNPSTSKTGNKGTSFAPSNQVLKSPATTSNVIKNDLETPVPMTGEPVVNRPETWSPQRQVSEKQYIQAITDMIRDELRNSIDKMFALFESTR